MDAEKSRPIHTGNTSSRRQQLRNPGASLRGGIKELMLPGKKYCGDSCAYGIVLKTDVQMQGRPSSQRTQGGAEFDGWVVALVFQGAGCRIVSCLAKMTCTLVGRVSVTGEESTFTWLRSREYEVLLQKVISSLQ